MIVKANALAVPLADRSVQTVITSPPYWGLRDYGIPSTIWGGDPMCEHSWLREEIGHGAFCGCDAWLGDIGLEPTPKLYVEHMVAIFREVSRVLRDDGTLWLNLGDCYSGSGVNDGSVNPGLSKAALRGDVKDRRPGYRGSSAGSPKHSNRKKAEEGINDGVPEHQPNRIPFGLKRKDLVGIPWRVAFALQEAGWYLRSDIIWSKPNPMPESVTDRPTRAHEYIFLLSKSERYFYDAGAIQESVTGNAHARGDGINPKAKKVPAGWDTSTKRGGHGQIHRDGRFDKQGDRRYVGSNERWKVKQNESFSGSINELVDARNKRSVWTVGTQPFPEAHFATFPTALIEPCILAGSRPGDIVLDPFFGAGTTAMVAIKHHRKWIGLELSDEYIGIARKRIGRGVQPVLI